MMSDERRADSAGDNETCSRPPIDLEATEKVDITAYIWYNVIIQYRR